MDEAVIIEQKQADANEPNRIKCHNATDQQPSKNETLDNMFEPNLAQEVNDDDLHECIHSNSSGKGYAYNFLNDRSDDTEVIERSTEESPLPSLVNSSFDSTENNATPSISHIVAPNTIDCTSLEETRHISNIQSSDTAEIPGFDPPSNSLKVVQGNNEYSTTCNHLMTIATNLQDDVLLLDGNSTVETEAADGTQGIFSSSSITDIDTMYAEACSRVSTAKEYYENAMIVPFVPDQKQKIDEDHSESLSGSYFTCRDEVSVTDNMSFDVSFHTACYNHGSITANPSPVSGKNIDENRSQQLYGFHDFLSCRSGDLSATRVDDQASEHDSSLLSYYTCRKFNQQGLISILKKGGADNDCNPGKQFNIPLDILINEAIESSSSSSVKLTKKYQQTFRKKCICYVGLFSLIILVTTVGIVFTIKQNSHSTYQKANNENASVPNNTNTVTTQAPTIYSTQAPSHAPTIMITDIVVSMYPSRPPSIQPSTSRHRDNIFLRPPKKKRTPTVKV